MTVPRGRLRVRMVNKFPLAARREAIRHVSYDLHGLPEITGLCQRYQEGTAVILGGGPSVDQYAKTIRTLQAQGALVLTIERMYPWCHRHGITPEYVVAQDASEDVIEAFATIWPGSIFLLAAQCPATVFARLKDEQTYFYHTSGDIPLDELGGPTATGVHLNAGGSVVLGSLSLAMFLGLSTLHLFGFDCHVTAGHYAQGIAGVGVPPERIQVYVGDRPFTTTLPYASMAQQFFELKTIGEQEGLLKQITVYGDSLVTAMSPALQGA